MAGQIQKIEQEIQQITPGRVLWDFIEERVGSEDYRKRLGIAAMIRRDFSKWEKVVRDSGARVD